MGTIAKIHEMLTTKQCSCTELTKSYLDEIEKSNGELNAYVNVTGDEALKTAEKVDKKIASGEDIGLIASVLVSFTIVAESSTIEPVPCIESHVEAAAVTDEVSFTAVPAKRANPSLLIPRKPPRVGKIRAAITLKRKITEID